MGRRDVRHVPALPRREPVGASALHQGQHAEHAALHAVTRTEPGRLQALLARDLQPLHQGRQAQRRACLPRVRRPERHPQRRGQRGSHQGMRRALRRSHLLHHVSGAHAGQLSGLRPAAQGPGCGLHLHQGHGGHAHALSHRAHGEGVQRRNRPAHPHPLPLRGRHGPRQHHQGRRSRRRHRGHRACAARVRQFAPRGGNDCGRLAGEPLRHGAGPGPVVRDRRILGRGAQARPLQARRVLARAHAGVFPSGAGRHDVQPGVPA